jgi:hypothetical protein
VSRSFLFLLVILLYGISNGRAQNYLDTITFGNAASETAHSFVGPNTTVIFNNALSPVQTGRQCQPIGSSNVYGGNLTFTMVVDPVWRNYFTIKLWGADDFSSVLLQASDQGRLYLYVPIGQFISGNTNNYQIGYRHEGDYICLNVAASHQPLPGRFFYSTTLLPLWMTQGRTNLILKIVSAGRIYTLGTSGTPPNGSYQNFMTVNSRSIYSAYTHTVPILDPVGEVQGAAPTTTIRPSPTESIMNPGGTFQSGVNNYINVIMGTTLTNLTTSEIEALALSYSISNLPAAYQQPAVVTEVMNGIDSFATNYFKNPSTSVSTGGGNESWGGRFGPLGHAINLLLPQLQSSLDLTQTYGLGGSMTRRQAWGQMLVASRDYGRYNRDGHNISNQGMISDQNIFMANMGLLALNNTNAFTETNAERYLREAVGLSPWLGSDLSSGGSSLSHGTNYFMVTSKGLSREWGYVGNDYGEVAYYAANFYQYTTNSIFRDQAAKMVRARSYFRRPAIEVSGSSHYQDMEAIGLLAWRGADDSDGDYAAGMAYGDRTQWADGMRVAGVTLDTNAIGYAKQMLADNEYFNQLIYDPNWYSGGSLAANSFDGRNSVLAFADYHAVSNAPDSGVRLPMTDGQPDFAWADEDDGIVAIKHNGERLWVSTYWQAKTGTGVNGIGRFFDSTTNFDRYGDLETSPQINFSGSFYVRPNIVDKPEQNFYVPPDNPVQAYQGESLPLGASDPLATDDEPFRGKALFWTTRYGNYLIGINRSTSKTYQLQTPSDFTDGTNLITGQDVTGPVYVAPESTVVLYLNSEADSCPPPLSPLSLAVVGDSTPKVTLDWSAASGALGYNVKRSVFSGGPYTTIANVTTTNYVDTNVMPLTTYYYVVSGTNICGESYYNSMENSASCSSPSIGLKVTTSASSYQNTMQPGDLGGTSGVRCGNWNNMFATNGNTGPSILTNLSIISSSGSVVPGMQARWYLGGGGSDGFFNRQAGVSNDGKLFADVADVYNNTTFANFGYLDLTNIPYTNYSIYCYFRDDNGNGSGNTRGGFWLITNTPTGSQRLYIQNQDTNGNQIALPSTSGNGYVQSTTTSIPSGGVSWSSIQGGNYAVFTGLTNTYTRIWFGGLGNGNTAMDDLGNYVNGGNSAVRLKVPAFQIVQSNPNAVTNLFFNPATITLYAGDMIGAQSILYAVTATGVTNNVSASAGYYIDNTNVVDVSAAGLFIPGTSGTANVIANYQNLFATNSIVVLGPASLSLVVIAGGSLQFSWPANYMGWSLEFQTNSLVTGLGTNWVIVAGSSTTNQITIPINSSNGCAFFQLVYP